MDCIFCNLDESKIILENEGARAIFDIFPVNKGHMLIVPKKHVVTYFDAGEEYRKYLWELVEECKKYIDKKFSPDGYNVGINCGEAAGQTVMHLHIHLIPRYVGDIENPRGGVRGVITEKKIYQAKDGRLSLNVQPQINQVILRRCRDVSESIIRG